MRHTSGIQLLMTTDAVGGVWSYSVDLARGLAQHGVQTTLAVLGPSPTVQQASTALAIPGLRLLDTSLPLEWLADSASELVRSGHVLAALAEDVGADLVHLNAAAPAAFARFPAPLVIACHSCVATWWQSVRGGQLPSDFRWRAELTHSAYDKARILIAPTAAFSIATAQLYGLQQSPLVIHNGRRSLVCPAAAPLAGADFVLSVGRLWDEGKNIGMLDRVAARLPMPVLAAGDAHGPNGATVDIRHIRLLGKLSEEVVAHMLSARPIFVSMARYEPFGLAVLEAAQAGCALVLSDTPSFRELWDGAAAFITPGDDAALVSTLQVVSADRERRSALGVAARERASKYTVEAQAGAMMAAYRKILDEGPALVKKEVAA